MDPIRYGIIGVGAVALRAHLPVLRMMDDVQVVALCNPSIARSEQGAALCRQQPALHDDYRELLAREDVDAVIIASPNHTHKEITLAAMDAGKHVLCEKPMATSKEDALAVHAAARGSKVVLQYGMELRYADLYSKMAEILESGQIGRPRMLFCREFRWPMLPGSGGWRTDNDRSGGALLEKNCHHFDLFNWFAGSKPVRVTAMGGRDVNPGELLDNAWVIVEYANGVRGCLGLCLFSPHGNDLEVSVVGDRGKLESFAYNQVIHQWGAERPDKTVYQVAFDPLFGDIAQEPREKERSILWERGMIYREHRAFIESIRTGKPPAVNVDVALESVLVPLAAQTALQTGQVVTIEG